MMYFFDDDKSKIAIKQKLIKFENVPADEAVYANFNFSELGIPSGIPVKFCLLGLVQGHVDRNGGYRMIWEAPTESTPMPYITANTDYYAPQDGGTVSVHCKNFNSTQTQDVYVYLTYFIPITNGDVIDVPDTDWNPEL